MGEKGKPSRKIYDIVLIRSDVTDKGESLL